MNNRTLLILAAFLAVIAGAALLFQNLQDRGGVADPDSSALIVGGSAIYVAEQAQGASVTAAIVRLEKPGFVAVHEDSAGLPAQTGAPGAIIGASGLLAAGETENAHIALSRETKDGETVYAMLHVDDGNGIFDPAKDRPAIDTASGAPVMMIVTINADAEEPEAVSL